MRTNEFWASILKKLMCLMLLGVPFAGFSQVDTYEIAENGYLRSPMEAKSGIVLSNNRFSEIYLLQDGELKSLVKSKGCGIYTQMNSDKTLVGFKSIDEKYRQAPAVLEVATGKVTLLEDYSNQCGQVSFANDGTMAYTMGNNLVVRKGEERKSYDLGFYTNIANISPDGKYVAYGNLNGEFFVKDLVANTTQQVNIEGGYNGVWSPDGSKLAVQTAQGMLSVLDNATGNVYSLGKGSSVSWAGNSTELVFTKVEGENEMKVLGSSVNKVRFDGTNAVNLLAASEDMPTDAVMTSDGKLLVAYSSGDRRGLAVRTMPVMGSIRPLSAIEEVMLYEIEEDKFGARFEGENKLATREFNKKPEIGTKSYQQTIDALDIPYLNQVYDVTAVNGCTKWGYVACAPTSACMFLGYFGLLDPVQTSSRYNSSIKRQYAYHIGNAYTNQAKTAKFSAKASGNGCSGIPGGYGFMWNSASPQSHMVDFMLLNGCVKAEKTYSSTVAWTTFQNESSEGRPYILCVKLGSSGHVILGFATNCVYTSSEGFIEKQGSFVCHDPYGDYNYANWPNFSGQHSSYDWVGVNNGYANIGEYYWSVYAVPAAEGEELPELPYVMPTDGSANAFAYALKSEVVGDALNVSYSLNVPAKSVNVNVKNAAGEVVATVAGAVRKGAQTATIDIANLAEGAYTWEVEVDDDKKPAIQEFTALSFYHPRGVDVDNNMESENFGTLYITEGMDAGESSTPTDYYSYNNAGGYHVGLFMFTPDMKGIKNEKTGKYAFMGDLTYTYHSYAADLARVRVAEDGRIFVTRCNKAGDYILYAPSQADLVKNDKWTSLLNGVSFNSSTYEYSNADGFVAAANVGLDVKGSGENLKMIALSANSTVFGANAIGSRVNEYALGNATVLPTPTSVTAMTDYTILPRCANVDYDDRGGAWYCQYRATPSAANPSLIYINENGEQKLFEGVGGAARGGGGIRVSPDGKQIAIASTTSSFSLYDLTFNESGVPTLTEKISVRHGIGTNVNDIAWDLAGNLYICGNSGEYLKGYAMPRAEAFTTKAASRYAFKVGSSAIENVDADDNAPVEYYNMQGVKVDSPENGVFIKKQGGKATKVVM